jgi:hypothetical protein
VKRLIYVALLSITYPAAQAWAADSHCCEHCGCQANCCKICRCVPEIKKVTKTEYDCECEDFCVPGKSHHEVVCDECGKRKHEYTPTCATMRTRKKLVKHETVTKKVTYKWVVENLCPACAARQSAEPGATETAQQPGEPQLLEARQVNYQTPGAPSATESPKADAPTSNDLKAKLSRLLNPLSGRDQAAR